MKTSKDIVLIKEGDEVIAEIDYSTFITEDDTPVDNIFSERQQTLLTDSLNSSWQGKAPDDTPFVVMANVGLFYSTHKPAVVPDVMLSFGVEPPATFWEKWNRSYFIWEYGKAPDIVVEVVSNLKGNEFASKLDLYAMIGIHYYVVYDNAEHYAKGILHVFELRGKKYKKTDKRFFSEYQIGVTAWEGSYTNQHSTWLRWTDAQGNIIPSGNERANKETLRAETEKQRANKETLRAESEKQRADILAKKLIELGINPQDLI